MSTDPVTAAGVFTVASAKQAGDTPDYGQGWAAYGKRLGVTAADGFSHLMIGPVERTVLRLVPQVPHHRVPEGYEVSANTTASR